MLFGSTLFGVLGAVLAIPTAATLQIVWREYRDYRRETLAQPIDRPPPPLDARPGLTDVAPAPLGDDAAQRWS